MQRQFFRQNDAKFQKDPAGGHDAVISSKRGFGPGPPWFSWMLWEPEGMRLQDNTVTIPCQGELRKHHSTQCKCERTEGSAVVGPPSDVNKWSNAAQLPRRYRLLLLCDRSGWKCTGTSDLGHTAHPTTIPKKLRPCQEPGPEGKAGAPHLSLLTWERKLSRILPHPKWKVKFNSLYFGGD